MKAGGIPSLITSLLAGLLLLVLPGPGFCLDLDRTVAQFYYKFWSEKEGAPSQINALAQTADGFLWIGSPRGLFHFDGVGFEEYKPQAGVDLPSHSIYSLMATPDGGLWIAFEPNGLGFLKDGSLRVFTRPEELPSSPVHCFARDHEGRIWAGTETGLVLRRNTQWISIGHEWNFAPEMIRYLFVDRDGTLWVATVKTVVSLKRGSKKFAAGGPVGTGVTSMSQGKDGRVWFADDGAFEVRPVPTSGHDSRAEGPVVAEDGLRELLFDRDGALWMTRMDSGIVRIRYPGKLGSRKYGMHDPELESFGVSDGFSGGFAYTMLEDQEGNIWVGCSNGLVRIRHSQVVSVNLPERYQKVTLLAREDGDLWVGTINEKPLLRIHGDRLLPEKAGGERASSVFRDANGDAWWGSRDKIWLLRGENIQSFPLAAGAVPDWMYEIMPSAGDGGLFVKLGDVGFVHFLRGVWDLGGWPKGVPREGTFRYGPSATYEDGPKRIWLGYTAGQVCVIDGAQVTCYSRNDGLDVGRIKVIRGHRGQIWVGGELGLMSFRDGRFRRVPVESDNQLGAVSGIIVMGDGGLWLNEMSGIVQIPAKEIRQFLANPSYRVDYRRFDYLDGLPGAPQMSFTNSTAVEASDGRLWFATGNGLARIDPAHLVRNLVPPPVSILSIGKDKDHQTLSNGVKFPAGTHTVEIHYTALSFSIPERVEFRYVLEGVGEEWQNAGTRRQANYSNLGPGPYRFRVIACNNDGVWNNTGAFLDFSIAPAYYQTSWFRMMCLAAFLGVLWGLYRYRLHQVERGFSGRLEERVAERTRLARDLHDTLLQSFHGLMLHFEAVSKLLPEGKAKEQLEGAMGRADRAIAEGRRAVYDLRASTIVTNDLAEALHAAGDEFSAGTETAFDLVTEGSTRDLHPIIRDEIYRISREALSNAFRHAHARHIEVEIGYGPRVFRLRIRDDGEGIPAEVLEQGRSGHFGLAGIRERAQQIGAELTIWSRPGSGTEIELSLAGAIAYRTSPARSWWGLFRQKGDGK